MLTTCLSLLRCTYGRRSGRALFVLAAVVLTAGAVFAQDTAAQPSDASPQQPASAPQVTVTVSCASKIGETTHCPADTSKGIVLANAGLSADPSGPDYHQRMAELLERRGERVAAHGHWLRAQERAAAEPSP